MSRKRLITVVFLMLSVLMVSLGCFASTTPAAPGYNKHIQHEGIARFSFEYPESYEKVRESVSCDYLYLITTRWMDEGYIDSSIRVQVFPVGWDGYSSVSELLEDDIKPRESWENYQILERSIRSIDGIDGEQVLNTYIQKMVYESDLKEETQTIRRVLFFEYDEKIWEIDMFTNESFADETEEYWGHLIETFEILD